VFARWYRPPELFFGASSYGFGVDVWAAGCILAGACYVHVVPHVLLNDPMCMLYHKFVSTTHCACCTTSFFQRPNVHVVPHVRLNDPMCMLYHMFFSTTQCACCTTCSSQRPNVHVVPHVRLNDPMCMLYHMFFSTTQCACCTSCSSQRPNKVRARRVSCSACCIMRKVQTFLTSKDAFLVLLTPTPCR